MATIDPFQFLLGRLETEYFFNEQVDLFGFQFLLGRLETLCRTIKKPESRSFNSS